MSGVTLHGRFGSATYGPEGIGSPYRYNLVWVLHGALLASSLPKRRVGFVMLNPSTATHEQIDPTIRRCVSFARRWGFDAVEIGNLFAYRATDPDGLLRCEDPVGPENDRYLFDLVKGCELVVCAWGSHPAVAKREAAVLALIERAGVEPKALKLTGDGHPWHPLYLNGNLRPFSWRGLSA